jgi:hypothetical protein
MINIENLEPELQEAVREYRHYGHEVFEYDLKVSRFNRDEDLKKLHEATEKRNYWQERIRELIKGRSELNSLLIG